MIAYRTTVPNVMPALRYNDEHYKPCEGGDTFAGFIRNLFDLLMCPPTDVEKL